MKTAIKLIDYFQINPDPALAKLGKREKINLIDSMFGEEKKDKGLLITYDLSHSGRRINNRIYTVKGQQDGVSSILHPYPKPILQHHNSDADPIGRFTAAEWQDLSSYAISSFNDISQFMDLQKAFDEDDPKKIYSSMKKYNLLTKKDWPGMGRLRVQARITDTDAIEKFLDGRYITFSAGSTTDRHVCSICNSDWAVGDFCDHRHGKIYDEDVCVFVTGKFEVMEGSVVNMPADDLSQVLSMYLTSDNKNIPNTQDTCRIDLDTIYLTDSTYNILENNMSEDSDLVIEQTTSEEIPVESSAEDSEASEVSTEDSEDSLSEDTNLVTEETAEETEAVISDDVEDVEEVQGNTEETDESVLEVDNELVTALINKLKKLGIFSEAINGKENTKDENGSELLENEEVQADNQETQETTENKEVCNRTNEDGVYDLDVVVDSDIDWYLLENALVVEVGDAKLSTERRKKLPASTFCGPERSFPVPDCAHVTAARRLIGRAKLSNDQRAKVLACVDRKAKNMDCNSDSDTLSELKQDYVSSLNKIEELEIKLVDVIKVLATKHNKDFSEVDSNNQLEVLCTWFNTIDNGKEDTEPVICEKVEDPSVASSDASTPTGNRYKQLGKFEQSIISRYNDIVENGGANAAERYLQSRRRYLPRGFHPSKLNES